jgi:hypothetical protein
MMRIMDTLDRTQAARYKKVYAFIYTYGYTHRKKEEIRK